MYFPKSQIKTGLYTNGGEFLVKETKKNYIGHYWKTSSNKYYSGRTPEDIVIEELELNLPPTDDNLSSEQYAYLNKDSSIFKEYSKLNSNFKDAILIPPSYSPKPSEDDYELGEFTRYFCKKTNEIIYIEINEETHDKLLTKDPSLLYQMYQPFKYKWKITGTRDEIYFTNKKVTEYMSKTFNLPMLYKFLKEDYIKFHF
jgi:hypothetical protein